jgi:oxygen-dependent protoporphyrinogen oxidase
VTDFVVVGGGVGGLVVARRLARAGADVTLYEASDRLGGPVAHQTVGGLVLDSGAESFATRGGTVDALATELGLGGEIEPPVGSSWLYRRQGAVPLPATSILGIPGVPLAADVISVVGRRAALRAQFDELIPGTVAADASTLGELVRRRMGDRMLEELVAPVTLGVHSTHPDDLDVDRVAPGLRAAMRREGSLAKGVRDLRERAPAGSAAFGIRGGIHRIVDELAADVHTAGVDVRLGRRVRADERFAADTIWAAPEDTEGTRVVLVTLVLDAPELDGAPRGNGLLVVPDSGVRAKALTHSTAKWRWLAERAEGKHVVRLSYEAPVAVDVARADASALLGVDLQPRAAIDSAVVEWVRPPRREHLDDDVHYAGETVAGTGLANVIAHATTLADELIEGTR